MKKLIFFPALLIVLILVSCSTKTYTIQFDSSSGTEVLSVVVKDKEKIKEPTTPTKEGFVFGGWYEDKNFTKKYVFNLPINSNMVLYAKWISKTTINYNVIEEMKNGVSNLISYEDYMITTDSSLFEPRKSIEIFNTKNSVKRVIKPEENEIWYPVYTNIVVNEGFILVPGYINNYQNARIFIYKIEDIDYKRVIEVSDDADVKFHEMPILAQGENIFASIKDKSTNEVKIIKYKHNDLSFKEDFITYTSSLTSFDAPLFSLGGKFYIKDQYLVAGGTDYVQSIGSVDIYLIEDGSLTRSIMQLDECSKLKGGDLYGEYLVTRSNCNDQSIEKIKIYRLDDTSFYKEFSYTIYNDQYATKIINIQSNILSYGISRDEKDTVILFDLEDETLKIIEAPSKDHLFGYEVFIYENQAIIPWSNNSNGFDFYIYQLKNNEHKKIEFTYEGVDYLIKYGVILHNDRLYFISLTSNKPEIIGVLVYSIKDDLFTDLLQPGVTKSYGGAIRIINNELYMADRQHIYIYSLN